MKKVVLKNKDGEEFNKAILEDPTNWLKERLDELKAENVEGVTFEIEDVSEKLATQDIIQKRKAEYPTVEEFMDAYFDGGKAEIDALKARREAIKAKYPKPAKVK